MTVYNAVNGQAPSDAKVGDSIYTNAGLYQIVQPGTPGSSYNPASGYSSINMSKANLTDAMTAYSQATSERNTAKSQTFAREQMKFQQEQNAKAMAFSAEQAQINRDYQERLSSTAHQREVADLIAGGLNPVLSAKYSGSSTPSGSSASGITSTGSKGDVDTTSQQMIGALINAVIGQATALQTTALNNQTSLTMSQNQLAGILGSANITASSNQYIQKQSQEFEEFMAKNYPQTIAGIIPAALQTILDLFGGTSSGKSEGGTAERLIDLYNKLFEITHR